MTRSPNRHTRFFVCSYRRVCFQANKQKHFWFGVHDLFFFFFKIYLSPLLVDVIRLSKLAREKGNLLNTLTKGYNKKGLVETWKLWYGQPRLLCVHDKKEVVWLFGVKRTKEVKEAKVRCVCVCLLDGGNEPIVCVFLFLFFFWRETQPKVQELFMCVKRTCGVTRTDSQNLSIRKLLSLRESLCYTHTRRVCLMPRPRKKEERVNNQDGRGGGGELHV